MLPHFPHRRPFITGASRGMGQPFGAVLLNVIFGLFPLPAEQGLHEIPGLLGVPGAGEFLDGRFELALLVRRTGWGKGGVVVKTFERFGNLSGRD